MKKTLLFLSLSTLILVSCKNETKDLSLNTKEDSLSYAIGVSIGSNITKDFESQGLDTVIDLNKLMHAMKSALDTGEAELAMGEEDANKFLQEYFMALQTKQQDAEKKKFEANIEKGAAFLAENGKREGVVTTASGLQYEILKKGTGAKPTSESVVETHYHGTFLDGKVFDSSVERGEAVKFPVNRVIPGWTEALQLMPVGSKWKVWVPYTLAYGDAGQPPKIPPYSTLIFEVELLGIEKK
jgi:FKBP-type peptidyl-prolyl cis-trans isomerase FklB